MLTLTACGEPLEDPTTELDETNVTVETEEEATEESNEEEIDEEDVEKESLDEQEPEDETEVSTQIASELTVHYLDVGQADATLLQYGDGDEHYNILYDTGDWRGSEVVTYLTNQGVRQLDLVIISHPDADHIGQLDQVMEAFEVGEVWMSGNESSSDTFQRGVEAVIASGADFDEPRAGEDYSIGPLTIDILYPDQISGKTNEESISALFTYGDIKFVFTGDASQNEETYMRNHFDINADILHLGHHGSDTSSDPAFIDAVSPQIAIYSAGAGNSYGHPSPGVITTIEERNIDLYGTDVHGTIVITTDGESISVDTNTQGEIAEESETDSKNQSESESAEAKLAESTGECININEASMEEVQEIIHIGPARAEDVIEQRPYDSVDDLERISGIGAARIADIKTEGIACVS